LYVLNDDRERGGKPGSVTYYWFTPTRTGKKERKRMRKREADVRSEGEEETGIE